MIPVKIDLHNFLAYKDPGPLSLEGVETACLTGSNGAGKSSLLDAITWALWGKARAPSIDDMIHQGQDEMSVTLEFISSGVLYKVMRKRTAGKRGSSLLDLHIWNEEMPDWRGIGGATIRETQEQIDQLLNLDYDTFFNSAFLQQGNADAFTTKTPAERKKILASILGLDQWDRFEDNTKAKIKGLKLDQERIDARLGDMEAQIDTEEQVQQELTEAQEKVTVTAAKLAAAESRKEDVDAARTRYEAANKQSHEIGQRMARRTSTIATVSREQEEAKAKAGTIEEDQAKLKAMQDELEQMPDVDPAEIERQTAVMQDTRQKLSTLEGENKALERTVPPVKAKIEKINSLTDPVCPTCGQPLSDEHKASTIAELEKEIEAKREEYRLRQEEIKALQVFLTPVEEELNLWKEQKTDCEAKAREIDQLQHRIELAEQSMLRIQDLEKRIEEASAEQAEDEVKLLEQQAIVAELQETILQADAARQEVARLSEDKARADQLVGVAQQKLAAIESLKEQVAKLTDERKEAADRLSIYEDLRVAFGKKGVPAMIIETVVPEIEASANDLLTRMTDGRMNVRIDTQKETKAGDIREALDIIISDDLGSRPYEMYSGGEAFRINFSIRIALSKLLARRAGAQLRSLFIDEGFGSQDAKGRENLVAAINSIQDDFDLILVITHIEELKEAFPMRIEIEKTADGSVFRVE